MTETDRTAFLTAIMREETSTLTCPTAAHFMEILQARDTTIWCVQLHSAILKAAWAVPDQVVIHPLAPLQGKTPFRTVAPMELTMTATDILIVMIRTVTVLPAAPQAAKTSSSSPARFLPER